MASGSATAGERERGGDTSTFALPRTRTLVLVKKGVVQLFTPAMAAEPSLGVRLTCSYYTR